VASLSAFVSFLAFIQSHHYLTTSSVDSPILKGMADTFATFVIMRYTDVLLG